MRKFTAMLMVLALVAPAFGAVMAQKSYDADVGDFWDTFDGSASTYSHRTNGGVGTITHNPTGNGSYPAGNPAFGGCGEFDPPSSIFHWDGRASGEKLFSSNEARTFEMWISPHVTGIGGSGYGGTLLILDGNGMWKNGNLFFFNNLGKGQRLFFTTDDLGWHESVGTFNAWQAGSWHHVCLSWDATNFMVGLDGVVIGNVAHGGLGTWSFGSDGGGYLLGLDTSGGQGTNAWNGWVDDVTVSDTGHYAQYTDTYLMPTAPIPEPASMMLLGLGALTLLRKRS